MSTFLFPSSKFRKPANVNINGISLADILTQHEIWSKSDGKEGKPSTFNYLNLRKVDFEGMNIKAGFFIKTLLEGANFRNAILTGSNFSQAHIQKADFSEANLDLCIFKQAPVRQTKFKKASMKGAFLPKLAFNAVDFRETDLSMANLGFSTFRKGKFENAKLFLTNFAYAEFYGCNLNKALGWRIKTKGIRFHLNRRKKIIQKIRPKKKRESIANPAILTPTKADKRRLLEYLTEIKIGEKSIEHTSVNVELSLDEMLDKYFQDDPEIQKISEILKNRK